MYIPGFRITMAPPALLNIFNSYEACDQIASPRGDCFTSGPPKYFDVDSLTDFIAKLSVVHLQRDMLLMQLNYGDCSHSNISRILNTKNIEMNREHAKNVDEPITDTIVLTSLTDDIEYDSLISESNSLENPSDEDVFYQEREYDCLFKPDSSLSSMNSSKLDSFSELHCSVYDEQGSDDDGHFSLDDDTDSDENGDFNSDTNCNDLPCTKDVPFWQTFFTLVESDDDDECDSDECEEEINDVSFPDIPSFCFNKLFENSQGTKNDSTSPSSISKANDRWNKAYTDSKICHKTPKVHFAADDKLETKHLMLVWSYAYQAARKGEWVQIHIDAERFRCRIENTEQVLNPILDPSHRLKIFALRKKYEHYPNAFESIY